MTIDSLAQIGSLKGKANELMKYSGIELKKNEIQQLNQRAADLMQKNQQQEGSELFIKSSQIESDLYTYDRLNQLQEVLEIAMELYDSEEEQKEKRSIEKEANKNINELEKLIQQLELQQLMGGQYDIRSAIVEIQSGAGGEDAQQWALTLENMYHKWAESKGYRVKYIQRVLGDRAQTIKNSSFQIQGEYAYGSMRSEKGTHRVIRISPFSYKSSRETSFASVSLQPVLDDLDLSFEIPKEELSIQYIRSSGAGGQHVNTTDSACRMKHIPTGIQIVNMESRSQQLNKEYAYKILKGKLIEIMAANHLQHVSDIKGEEVHAEWGQQIRNYIFHPYKLIKDVRTNVEVRNVDSVLQGDIDIFQLAFLKQEALQRNQKQYTK